MAGYLPVTTRLPPAEEQRLLTLDEKQCEAIIEKLQVLADKAQSNGNDQLFDLIVNKCGHYEYRYAKLTKTRGRQTRAFVKSYEERFPDLIYIEKKFKSNPRTESPVDFKEYSDLPVPAFRVLTLEQLEATPFKPRKFQSKPKSVQVVAHEQAISARLCLMLARANERRMVLDEYDLSWMFHDETPCVEIISTTEPQVQSCKIEYSQICEVSSFSTVESFLEESPLACYCNEQYAPDFLGPVSICEVVVHDPLSFDCTDNDEEIYEIIRKELCSVISAIILHRGLVWCRTHSRALTQFVLKIRTLCSVVLYMCGAYLTLCALMRLITYMPP